MVGSDVGPPSHQASYLEVGDPKSMVGKDKFFAIEQRGGYPWADGFFNRNDTAPLPKQLDGNVAKFTLHISDAPPAGDVKASLTLRFVLFQADETDVLDIRLNGMSLPITTRDAEWKDAQILSPKLQRTSGGKGDYQINPQQRLLRLDYAVPREDCKLGANEAEIQLSARALLTKSSVQLEKMEAHLRYQ